MAGTAVLSTIKHDVTGAATTFRDGAGNEIGRLARAFANFDGSAATLSPRASFNVSSLTDNGTGDYTVTFTNAFTDASFAISTSSGSGSIGLNLCTKTTSLATGTARFTIASGGGSAGDGDPVSFIAIR